MACRGRYQISGLETKLPAMAREDEFVTVATLYDPVQAEVIRDVLAQEGITATVPGTHHSALYGAAGSFVELRLQVRAGDADRATDIIAAMDDESSVVVDDSEEAAELSRVEHVDPGSREGAPGGEPGAGPYRSPPQKKRLRRPRLKRVAAFLSVGVTFGTGHLYARETLSGAMLTVAELAALFAATTTPVVAWAIPVLMLVDLVGSMRAVDRHNAGSDLPKGSQAIRTGALAGVAYGFALGVVPVVAPLLTPEPETLEGEEPRMGEPPAGGWEFPFRNDQDVEDVDPLEAYGMDEEPAAGDPEHPPSP